MSVGRPRCRPAELGWRRFIANASVVLLKLGVGSIRVGEWKLAGTFAASRNIHDGGLRYQYVCTAWLQQRHGGR